MSIVPGDAEHSTWKRRASYLETESIVPGDGEHRTWRQRASYLETESIVPGDGEHRTWRRRASYLETESIVPGDGERLSGDELADTGEGEVPEAGHRLPPVEGSRVEPATVIHHKGALFQIELD